VESRQTSSHSKGPQEPAQQRFGSGDGLAKAAVRNNARGQEGYPRYDAGQCKSQPVSASESKKWSKRGRLECISLWRSNMFVVEENYNSHSSSMEQSARRRNQSSPESPVLTGNCGGTVMHSREHAMSRARQDRPSRANKGTSRGESGNRADRGRRRKGSRENEHGSNTHVLNNEWIEMR